MSFPTSKESGLVIKLAVQSRIDRVRIGELIETEALEKRKENLRLWESEDESVEEAAEEEKQSGAARSMVTAPSPCRRFFVFRE